MRSVERRLQEILDAAGRVPGAGQAKRLYLRIEPEVLKLGYVATPVDLPQDVVLAQSADEPADVALFTQHGLDVSPAIWAWRQKHPDGLVLLWAWDNHLGQLHNLHSALAADIVFPSHAYVSDYLSTPMALLGPHLPACSAQWHGGWQETDKRSDRLMAHYVDYPWAGRTRLLSELAREGAWVDARLMSPEDKRPYFGKSSSERLQEWLEHKVSLVLPVDRDLSTRFFDALYAGQIPLLAGDIADLDSVISPALREDLGIVHVPEMTLKSVQNGYARALTRFNEGGVAGVARRHRFATENHMFKQRIATALACVEDLKAGCLQPRFLVAPGTSGLRLSAP
jgi:hypothetical protein